MAERTSSPSGVVAGGPPARTRVDVGRWLGGIRVSGFAAIMLGLVVLGVFVLVPTIGTYAQQQQQLASVRNAVQVTKGQVAELERERERWKDPAYITTQARARLYYVKPGEVVFLVDNDLPAASQPREQQKVSAKVEQTHTDWMSQLVRSVTAAGVSETAAPVG
ncbi:FtsB family cell division protein [Microbacterium rhizosphaerae]|uniref:Septum formation initiator family protein n=1 Tax=Microbacterium rhizosphaerae TaxID=1678237 RepID=A0ABZ0SIZ6_9MICO|nr:septum formation initiator family protein [Microbacterium rhizosphaerae]WPR88558.1 septum formation initiator family protein [Microbacterium rhizosphaerae]